MLGEGVASLHAKIRVVIVKSYSDPVTLRGVSRIFETMRFCIAYMLYNIVLVLDRHLRLVLQLPT
jgi:hypothetical protein